MRHRFLNNIKFNYMNQKKKVLRLLTKNNKKLLSLNHNYLKQILSPNYIKVKFMLLQNN